MVSTIYRLYLNFAGPQLHALSPPSAVDTPLVLLHFSGHLVNGAGLCEALHVLAFEMLLRLDFYMGEIAHTRHKLDA